MKSEDQNRFAEIKERVAELVSDHKREMSENKFITVPAGTVIGDLQFLVKQLSRLSRQPETADEGALASA